MFPAPLYHLFLLSFLVVLGLSLCMQTTAFDIRNENSPVMEVQCMEKERQALLNVKKGLLDPSHRLSSWVEKVNCCQWRGVKCNNRTGHVVTLDLHNRYFVDIDHEIEGDGSTSLGGEISSSLLDLQYLQHLDLSFNNFGSNPIPEFFGSLVQLRSLNLSCAFGGRIPHQIGNLSNLNYLDLNCLYRSSLSVTNLDWLSRLGSLIYLNMSGINLSLISDLFNNIYRLPSLKHLRLRDCRLDEISYSSYLNRDHANFTSIKYIHLSGNGLSCTIFKYLGNVTSLLYLDLSYNQLKCSIPGLLRQMESLEYLDLSGNSLKGPIPTDSLANLSSLSFLDFYDNKLEGWMPVSNVTFPIMASLAHLGIRLNNLKGPIPDFLGKITSLTDLDLSANHLEGGVPSDLGKLCNLQTLSLSDNNLSGDITDEFWSGCINNSLENMDLSINHLHGHFPEDLGRFSSLINLHLHENRLKGNLPTSMGQLTDLVSLDVSSNSLAGVISESHLSNLSKLRDLDLSYNSLSFNLGFNWTPPLQLESASFSSCLLGPRFPLWLRMQQKISYLDISDTGINDTIPNWFWNFSSNMNSMHLSSNHIYGKLPTLSLALLKKISIIDLSSNLLEGSIPGISPSTEELILSDNSFSGTLSDLLCNVSSIPNSLHHLDLSENQLVGSIPDCLDYWRDVYVLNLKKNNFSGEIPYSIGYMNNLESLYLYGNNLSGVLPLSLKNCTSLLVINAGENRITGEIPPWIGENLAQLVILRLHSNGFTGNIPSQLCQNTRLQILDLAHNNLQGIIPRCLHNISAMSSVDNMGFLLQLSYMDDENITVVWKGMELEYRNSRLSIFSIDFSSNNLSGGIPMKMMYLSRLCSLNLSRNSLFGKIPDNIGNLSYLESLDFSRNNLSGFLPIGLADISSLSNLDLWFNNFSGTIPTGTQLQSFNVSSYIGNLGLRGPPLSVNCTTNGTSSQDHHPTKNEDETDFPGFYIGMAVGYIVGVWVVCGILLFKRSWRIACFRFIEEVHDWLYVVLVVNARKLQRKFGNL